MSAGAAPASSTPVLDRWAKKACIFRRTTTPAPFTMPAMAATISGSYPDRCGISQHEPGTTLYPWRGQTLAEAARRAGLRTAAVIANPWLVRQGTGFDRGFESFSRVYGPDKDTSSISATAVTDEAIRVLEAIGRDRFFVWVHYFDPHMPYEPPAAHAKAATATPGASPIMEDFRAKGRDLHRIYRGAGYTNEALENARRLYDGEVRYVDHEIGRLFEELERRGRTDDTIVVVVSDHGESLGEHGLFFAHDYTLYDELVRVALLMRGPGIQAATRDENASLIDVAPTICRLASLGCDGPFDGVDLFGAFPAGRTLFAASTPARAKTAPFDRLEVPGFHGRWTMALAGSDKLLRIPTTTGPVYELYDLTSDPLELRNLSPGTEARGRLERELSHWSALMDSVRPPSTTHKHRHRQKSRETLRSLGYLQ